MNLSTLHRMKEYVMMSTRGQYESWLCWHATAGDMTACSQHDLTPFGAVQAVKRALTIPEPACKRCKAVEDGTERARIYAMPRRWSR